MNPACRPSRKFGRVLDAMPKINAIEKRNTALIALILLNVARDNTVASARLKHLDLVERVCHLRSTRRPRDGQQEPLDLLFLSQQRYRGHGCGWVEYLRSVEGLAQTTTSMAVACDRAFPGRAGGTYSI